MLNSSCSSDISSLLRVLSNVRKDWAGAGMLADTVTTSLVSRSLVAGKEYDQGVGSFVFTIVRLVGRSVAKSGLRLGAF